MADGGSVPRVYHVYDRIRASTNTNGPDLVFWDILLSVALQRLMAHACSPPLCLGI
jgi:hypothetical protein